MWMSWLACATRSEAWEPGERVTLAGHDEDEESEESEEEEEREGLEASRHASPTALRAGVPPVTHPLWQSECGSCHMAYSPGLLPARSWTAILADLGHHYGDDATVDPATLATLSAYAAANAADVAPYRLSMSLARAAGGTTPTRILDIGGLRHEHQEVPRSWVVDNPEVRSLSNCAACHPGAAAGSFDEHDIRIPGHGRFDD